MSPAKIIIKVVLVLVALGQFAFGDNAKSDLPNIVVYLSDDHSQFDCQLYGANDIPTPNLEKLASAGMVFTHAFVASPSCAPSRAAMLTGLMPARNGAEANHTYPRAGTHYLIDDLKNAGYEVTAFGKVGHGKQQSNAPFDSSKPGADYAILRRNVESFLNQRSSDKPLCLFIGISNPHVPTLIRPLRFRLLPILGEAARQRPSLADATTTTAATTTAATTSTPMLRGPMPLLPALLFFRNNRFIKLA